MDENFAKYLLEKVKRDYNLLAEDYDRKREYIPEDIKKLAEYAKEGDKVLDAGCGNGRLFKILKEKKVNYYGIDFSEKLIEISRKKFPEGKFEVGDCLNLPFPDNFFDKVFSISVLHHIPGEKFRIQYLKEAKRVLKKDGLLIMRVWDFWKRKEGIKIFLKHFFSKISGRSKLDFFDVFLPWKDSQGKILAERYFHCFRKRELENLVRKLNFEIIKCWRGGEDPRTNIYLIGKRP